MYHMLRLVEEYDQKPGLVPPLVILEDLYKLVKGIWKVTCRNDDNNFKLCSKSLLINCLSSKT